MMNTTNHHPAPAPPMRRDWTCLASALLIALMLSAVLTLGSIWLYTFSRHAM